MTESQKNKAAKEFAEYWKGTGYEKGQSQTFWLMLLRNVYGLEEPEKYIRFEDKVHLDSTSFIDGYIDETHVLIEQKSLGKDLKKPIRQSDGTFLTPFQQAQRYSVMLPYSMRPRWIVTCNFETFLVYDMEKPTGEPEEIKLSNLPNEFNRLNFLIKQDDEHIQRETDISVQAGELVGKMYNAFLKQYREPDDPLTLKSLNKLCVRLVFCLFAEDANIFGKHLIFHDYLVNYGYKKTRGALIELFRAFATPTEKRDPYLDDDVAQFPYVRGLFEDEEIEIPQFTEELYKLLLDCCTFDWSQISPTIFGAVFESTLNPETRRSGGMHYTSIENIHKVIDPLFLDDLKNEFEEITQIKILSTRKKRLFALQEKMAKLRFLDPACGSGNFLTETYISLRRLENKIVSEIYNGQITMGEALDPIKVKIDQFYGIEINDFAVTVAQTALWIAESQMMTETEQIVHTTLDFLPLKTYANIVEGNALSIDWNDVVPKETLSYCMGNILSRYEAVA